MKKTFLISFKLLAVILISAMYTACEGPPGIDGVDVNENCKLCHNASVVDAIKVQFDFSKHSYGEAAFEEAGRADCAPCHSHQGFKYVCDNNVPATFSIIAPATTFSNNYVSVASATMGEMTCFTCHSSLHSTYGMEDFAPLTSVAAVSMNMWKGDKTINLSADGGVSNLCVRCHQPRPIAKNNPSASTDKNVLDYNDLVANPSQTFWQGSNATNGTGDVKPGYRTGVHYGTVGSIFAGVGGVQFTGSKSYTNSAHTNATSCKDCHMAEANQRGGGHTFNVKMGEPSASFNASTNTTDYWNLNGCKTSGCHSSTDPNPVANYSSTYFKDKRLVIKGLLDQLASRLTISHYDGNTYSLLKTDTDRELNLWYWSTTNHYDGYFNIYDANSNPTGQIPNTWFTITKAEMGAVINFQLALREYSLGIHNFKYVEALLTNTIETLDAL